MSSNPHGNNPFGRPAGNKDGRHVKRGPNNNNPKGRPTKELEQARKETDRVAKAAAQAVKDNQDLQKRLREIEEKRRKFHEEARTVLASIGADATVDTNLDDDDDDHTNDDDDDDDYDIDGENEVHINGNGVKAKLTRPSYMPPKGSCLFNQMEEIEKKFASGGLRTFSAQKGMWCYGCSEKKDPVASNSESPDAWYASKFECFTWMPFDYFGTAVDIKSINCVHDGCNSCSLKKLALAWRPVICIDKVAWVLHHRIQCKDCKKTFSTIDPKFLAQLPTRILERFPFMTGKKGPGIHQSLVFHFISLIGKGIMYGTYANSINELHRIRYSMETISYYDTIAEKKDLADNIEFDFIPKVFSNFDSAGEYGGIKLTAKLLRRFTFNYILSREKYFQASFQMVYDEGNASDHTHKLSKVIQLSRWKGDVFTASYTVLSQKGLVCFNRFTYTKGSRELNDLLKDYKECRGIANAGPLKIFSSDCLQIDGGLWERTFKEDLTDNVAPYKSKSADLPLLGIHPDKFVYLYTADSMNSVSLAIMDKFESEKRVVYGFDTEYGRGERFARTLQISLPSLNGEHFPVYVFDLNAAGILPDSPNTFPQKLKILLLQKHFIPTGRHVGNDCTKLHQYGININCWVELRGMALEADPTLSSTGLAYLAERFLQGYLDKEGQTGDYTQIPLPFDLQKYAALDALVSRMISEKLASLLKRPQADVIYEGPETFDINSRVELYLGGSVVADCTIIHIGRRKGTDDITRKWGATTVKSGKAIVKIERVHCQSVHPPLSFKKHGPDETSWKKEDVTLEELVGKEILVHTSDLVISLDVEGMENGDGELLQYHIICEDDDDMNVEERGKRGNSIEEKEQQEHAEEEDDPFLTFGADEDLPDDDESTYRSRKKEDIFHQFKNLPLGKREPARAMVSRLLIHATFIFDDEDFCKVERYLQIEKGFDDADPMYMDKLTRHFYHNREWWREHCRMYIPKALDHATRLKRVISILEKDAYLSTLMTDEVKAYFDSFLAKILRGEFEDQNDVVLFIKNGENSHGLPCYLRLRGTVRTENLHQKMKTSIGPWGVGAQTGHTMLLLTCYRFNVKSQIRRCGAYDFGHYELHIIDRIQNRVKELFNIVVWPRHKNMSYFQGKKDFISVGIGPLCYDSQYVHLSDTPANILKGDYYFIAKQMGLLYPLLHIGSREEINIFTNFMMQRPKATMKDFEELARIFKTKADGIRIFPKLPTMLKSYFKTWERNAGIKSTEKSMDSEVNALLKDLFSTRISDKLEVLPPTHEVLKQKNADINVEDSKPISLVLEEGTDFEMEVEEPSMVYVPPVQAVAQSAYIPSHNVPDPIDLQNYRCAWYPYCLETRSKCKGRVLSQCQFLGYRCNDQNYVAEMKAAKAERTKERDREKKKLKRAREKDSKAKSTTTSTE